LGARLVAGVGLALAPAPSLAQEPASADAAPPSLAETITFVNSHLTEHASPWRPCKATAQLALAEGGDLTIEVTRSSYCEDSKLVASVQALDAARISYEVANEIVVVIPCEADADCARQLQRRKKRDGESWAFRDDDWIPMAPRGQEHILTAVELPMSSRAERAADVASAMAYLIKAAKKDPTYKTSTERFKQEPPAPSTADGG
jgi:hypothetical protein